MATFEEQLEKNGVLVYTNKGVSMLPLLRQGRDVMVIEAKKDGFRKNDAVLFKRDNGQYVLHRITKRHPDGSYTIIGDNCISGERVREDQLLGVLTQVRRDGKTVSVSDPGYRLYVKSVPARRLLLRGRTKLFRFAARLPEPVKAPLKKIYHIFK